MSPVGCSAILDIYIYSRYEITAAVLVSPGLVELALGYQRGLDTNSSKIPLSTLGTSQVNPWLQKNFTPSFLPMLPISQHSHNLSLA